MTNCDPVNEKIQLITERLSISDKVTEKANLIYNEIEKIYSSFPWKKIKDGMIRFNGSKKYILFNREVTLNFIIFQFSNDRILRQEIENIPYRNEFDSINMTLTLTIVMLANKVYKEFSESPIYHEIEHL